MIKLMNVCKTYYSKSGREVAALKNVTLSFPEKGMFFITGKSGCGKTTLLNILGGLDSPTEGEIFYKGRKIELREQKTADEYRKQAIGFVFQNYNLLDNETVFENVDVAARLVGKTKEDVEKAIDQVGLTEYAKHCADELSGGQKQRVAVARALVKSSEVILADEPTGNLDSATAEDIFSLLKDLSKERLVIVVTHDRESAEKYGNGFVRISDGKIVEEFLPEDATSEKNPIAKDSGEKPKSILKKTLFRLGVKNLGYKKGRSILATVMLFLSVTVLSWAQMLISTSSEKVLARTLPEYGVEQLFLFQGLNVDYGGAKSGKWGEASLSEEGAEAISKYTSNVECVKMNANFTGALIEKETDIASVGIKLYDGAMKLEGNDYFYVSDYKIDELHKLREGGTSYTEYIGKEIEIGGYKGILAGVYATGYHPYVIWDSDCGCFQAKGGLTTADREKIGFISDLKNVVFCSKDYLLDHFDSYVYGVGIRSDRNEGTVYYDRKILTFSSGERSFARSEGVTLYDTLSIGGETIVAENDEIYLSITLYRQLFEPAYKKGETPQYLGEKINVSLQEYDDDEILATISEKTLSGVYDGGGAYSFVVSKDSGIDFKWYAIKKPFVLVGISELSTRTLTKMLSSLRSDYEILARSVLSYEIYLAVEGALRSGVISMLAVAIVMFIAAVLLIVNLVLTTVSSKAGEIGILRAMGMRANEVGLIYLTKIFLLSLIALALSVMGALLGVLISPFIYLLDASTVIYWLAYDWITLLIGIVMSVGVPLGISALVLRKINNMKPVDAIKGA